MLKGGKMSIIDMAKAHVQNVNQRIEELLKQQQLIQNEVENLRTYLENCLKDIQSAESSESN
jgi:ElaB/YqjD/DUF883 family membrane-anchored ribosome-binding protein